MIKYYTPKTYSEFVVAGDEFHEFMENKIIPYSHWHEGTLYLIPKDLDCSDFLLLDSEIKALEAIASDDIRISFTKKKKIDHSISKKLKWDGRQCILVESYSDRKDNDWWDSNDTWTLCSLVITFSGYLYKAGGGWEARPTTGGTVYKVPGDWFWIHCPYPPPGSLLTGYGFCYRCDGILGLIKLIQSLNITQKN